MAEKCPDNVELKNLVYYSDLGEEPLRTLSPIQGYEHMPIVTLEEAITPLIDLIPDIKQMVYRIKENCQEIKDDLTINESASIMLYTMKWKPKEKSLNQILNRILRQDNRDELKPFFSYLKLFYKSLSKLPSIDSFVYQTIPINLSMQYPQGKTFTWWSFSLCTSSLEDVQDLDKTDQRTRFKIECKSGKNIQNHLFHKTNYHTLLLPAKCYKIMSSLDSGNGLHIIQIKEIDPLPLLQLMLSSSESKLTRPSSTYQNGKVEELISLCKSNLWIDLSIYELIDRDMPFIIQQAIIDKKCKGLFLAGNHFTFQGISRLANALYDNETLIELDLADNFLPDMNIKSLLNVLSTNRTKLEKLHLGSNCLTDEGVVYIVDSLKTNQFLTHLILNHNGISDRGVHLLSNVLGLYNTTLEVLSLSSNILITDLSIDSFIIMIKHNEILKVLDIRYCNISQTSCLRLQQLLKQRKDFKLYFDSPENSCILS